MNAAQPLQQQGDALAFQEILSLAKQSVGHYNAIADEVRARLDRIATERAALGALHTRLIALRKPVKEWDNQLWKMGYGDVPRDALLTTERQVRAHRDALDDLIWQLFDFKERDGGQP